MMGPIASVQIASRGVKENLQVIIDKLVPPPVEIGGDGDDSGLPPGPFLILRDVREEQPDERIQTDGVQDHPFIALLGFPEGLSLNFTPGTRTLPESEEPFQILLDREVLKAVWPILTVYVETGKWTGWAKSGTMPDSPCPEERL